MGFFKKRKPETPAKKVSCILISRGIVGKTALGDRYVEGRIYPNKMGTVGLDLKMKAEPFDGNECKLTIWDTPGLERYITITQSYIPNKHIIIACYDISNRDTFTGLDSLFDTIDRFVSDRSTVVLVANKCDLKEEQRKVSYQEGKDYADKKGIPFFECSAKNGQNVKEVFTGALENHFSDFCYKPKSNVVAKNFSGG